MGVCGMKYRNLSIGNFWGIRLLDGMLYLFDGVWGNFVYIVVFLKGVYVINVLNCWILKNWNRLVCFFLSIFMILVIDK